ncbi:MAG: hypothetical protein IT532_04070 [Burkholderiales bacterium]|nr:hypothetical protein [Burkholderiales bacterium]
MRSHPACLCAERAREARRWSRQACTVARFTLLESARARLAWTVGATLLGLSVCALLVEQLAITEGWRLRAVFLAASARLVMVALLCQHVIVSVVREFNDGAVSFALSLPVTRSAFYSGKLLGFSVLALLTALLTAGTLAFLVEPERLAFWCALLAAELSLMVGVALFCAMGTQHALLATLLCAGFYVLARSTAVLESLVAQRLEFDDTTFTHAVSGLVHVLAYVLPDLSRFARTEWLADVRAGGAHVAAAAIRTAVYLVLTACAGIHDLERRNL